MSNVPDTFVNLRTFRQVWLTIANFWGVLCFCKSGRGNVRINDDEWDSAQPFSKLKCRHLAAIKHSGEPGKTTVDVNFQISTSKLGGFPKTLRLEHFLPEADLIRKNTHFNYFKRSKIKLTFLIYGSAKKFQKSSHSVFPVWCKPG